MPAVTIPPPGRCRCGGLRKGTRSWCRRAVPLRDAILRRALPRSYSRYRRDLKTRSPTMPSKRSLNATRCRSGGPRSRQAVPGTSPGEIGRRAVQATVCWRIIRTQGSAIPSAAGPIRDHSSDCRPRGWWTLSVRPHPGADCRLYGEVGTRVRPTASTCSWTFTPRGLRLSRARWFRFSEARAVPSKLRNKNPPGTVWFSTAPKSAARWCAFRCLPFAETGGLTAKNSPADYFHQPGCGRPRPRVSRNVRPSYSRWYQRVRDIDRTKRGLSPRRAGRSPPQPPPFASSTTASRSRAKGMAHAVVQCECP